MDKQTTQVVFILLFVSFMCAITMMTIATILTPYNTEPPEGKVINQSARDEFWDHITEACQKQNKIPGLKEEALPDGSIYLSVGCQDVQKT